LEINIIHYKWHKISIAKVNPNMKALVLPWITDTAVTRLVWIKCTFKSSLKCLFSNIIWSHSLKLLNSQRKMNSFRTWASEYVNSTQEDRETTITKSELRLHKSSKQYIIPSAQFSGFFRCSDL
jgi:hypothetical protein